MVKVKANRVKENRVTRSRNTMPMIRGVSWALANCTTSNRMEERNTMKVNMAPAKVPNSARAASGSKSDCQPARCSIQSRHRTDTNPATMPSTDKSQIEFRT